MCIFTCLPRAQGKAWRNTLSRKNTCAILILILLERIPIETDFAEVLILIAKFRVYSYASFFAVKVEHVLFSLLY